MADDATLLFHLGTDMTGVCVCCVLSRHGAARSDDMLIGDRSGRSSLYDGDYFIIFDKNSLSQTINNVDGNIQILI